MGDLLLGQEKRHRAAALHDAGAKHYASLLPRGRGVRQPYAALTSVHLRSDFPENSKPSASLPRRLQDLKQVLVGSCLILAITIASAEKVYSAAVEPKVRKL